MLISTKNGCIETNETSAVLTFHTKEDFEEFRKIVVNTIPEEIGKTSLIFRPKTEFNDRLSILEDEVFEIMKSFNGVITGSDEEKEKINIARKRLSEITKEVEMIKLTGLKF